jgi:hypothetical protein
LSLSVSARYCPPPVFFSRTDSDEIAKYVVTETPSNFAASAMKKSFMLASIPLPVDPALAVHWKEFVAAAK